MYLYILSRFSSTTIHELQLFTTTGEERGHFLTPFSPALQALRH